MAVGEKACVKCIDEMIFTLNDIRNLHWRPKIDLFHEVF